MRRHARVPMAGAAHVSFGAGEERVTIEAFILNISVAGIGLYTDAPLEKDRDVSIELNFIAGDHRLHRTSLEGSVIYSKQIKTFNFCGIKLHEEIADNKKQVLYEHIRRVAGRRK